MSAELDAFVSGLEARHVDQVAWGEIRLALRFYLSRQPPPLSLITSVRAVVFRRGAVVVVNDRAGGAHIMPGGRIEPGETVAKTLEREVLEECGWTLASAILLGFIHFRHLAPRPVGYAYPYPDFLHLLFVGEADHYRRNALKRAGEIETGSRLTTIRRAMAQVRPDQKIVLQAALAARSPS
jgi:ADP-ribose pyrophosphatase YjhB (NUDIX family)